jgi:hypothetical protein
MDFAWLIWLFIHLTDNIPQQSANFLQLDDFLLFKINRLEWSLDQIRQEKLAVQR